MPEASAADALIGHNSNMNEATREKLRQIVAKVERLVEERGEVNEQIKEVFSESKAMGFDNKAIRQVIAIRKKERSVWEEEQMILDTYLTAMGLI